MSPLDNMHGLGFAEPYWSPNVRGVMQGFLMMLWWVRPLLHLCGALQQPHGSEPWGFL